jgi:hypothetical protein
MGTERPVRDADPSHPSSTVAKKELSYTSTPSMGRTASTEPQCLYKGALYLTFTYEHKYITNTVFLLRYGLGIILNYAILV